MINQNEKTPVEGATSTGGDEGSVSVENEENIATNGGQVQHPASVRAALACAALGLPVFPCNPNKSPLTTNGFKDATTDAATIEGWWARWPRALIGMPTGVRSNVAVLDIDVKKGKDGFAAISNWESRTSVIAQTRSGGAHLYFRNDEAIRCSSDKIAPGVDTRGEGGYVIVPPSDGYRWHKGNIVDDLAKLPPWPDDLRPALSEKRRPELPQWLRALALPDVGKGVSLDPADRPEPASPGRIHAALKVVSPNVDRNTWIAIGCGLYKDLGHARGLAAWDWWSQLGEKYPGESEILKQWASIQKADGYGYNIGTLFHHASAADPNWWKRIENSSSTVAAPAVVKRTKLDDFIKNAGDLQNEVFPELQWLVPKYIPEGLSLIAGPPKIGKSWFALGTALATASGGEYLGENCEQGDVLGLFLEDNDRRLQRRITALLGAFKAKWPTRLKYATSWPSLNQGGLDLMREWIAKVERPRMIIVDVLAKVRDPSTGRENQYASDYNALSAMQQMTGEHGLSNITLHHLRKMIDEHDAFANISGTYGLSGAADSTLVLIKEGLGKTLHGRGRDLEEFSVAVKLENFRWTVLGPASEVHVTEQRKKIIDAIRSKGGEMTIEEIAKTIDKDEGAVRVQLFRMVSTGILKRVKTGVFDLPDKEPF